MHSLLTHASYTLVCPGVLVTSSFWKCEECEACTMCAWCNSSNLPGPVCTSVSTFVLTHRQAAIVGGHGQQSVAPQVAAPPRRALCTEP